jgi:undecaprenyl-diphosphatase
MSVSVSIILGFIEGLTEFLPISSSGHLIIARDLFHWQGSGDLAFDAVLQLATIMAVIFYFHKDIMHLLKAFFKMIFGKVIDAKDKTMIWAIIWGTIPAVIAGLLLQKYMETSFRSAILVCIVLIIGSGVMYLAEKYATKNKELTVQKGITVGFFQCLALVPGFSRSGATISGGLFMGLNREEATRFSFLLSIPIILGSGLKEFLSIAHSGFLVTNNLNIFFGSLTAFVVGIFAIDFLMKFLKKYSLNIFIYYRVIIAVVVMSVLLLR